MNKPKIPFTPAPLRARHDGWTAERQIAFIEAFAECGCVEEACRRVGMSDSAAYALRRRPSGASFREAWDAAQDYSLHRLESAAFGRAQRGVPRPIFHKGEQVGEWRHFDERLTMFLLRSRRPERYGKWIERMIAPDADDPDFDPAIRLDGGLERIAWQAEAEELRPQDCPEQSGEELRPPDCRKQSEDGADK